MRKICIVLLVGFFLVGYNSLVFGQIKFDSGTSNTIGGTTFYNNSDGSSGTSNTIGGTTFHNLNRR